MGNDPESIEDPNGVLSKSAILTESGEYLVGKIASEFFGIGDGGYYSVIVQDERDGSLSCIAEGLSGELKSKPFDLNPQQWRYDE